MDTREAQSRSPWSAAPLLACLPFGFRCPDQEQEHRFHIPSQVHNLACSNRGKGGKTEKKRWEKDNHLFPAGKIAITLFSFSPSNPHESYRCLLTCRNTRSLICSFFMLCFSVRLRFRGVPSNALDRLKYFVRREADKILHTAVTDSGLYAVVTVTQDAELDDREMTTQACLWLISFIDFVQRPFSPGFIPGLCN